MHASESTRHAGNYFVTISIRPIFCYRSYVKLLDYWRAEKNISLLPEAPWGLRRVAFATSATWLIRHWHSVSMGIRTYGQMGQLTHPLENGWKIKKRKHAKKSSFLCLCYTFRAIRAGRCRERRYADHIYSDILQNAPFRSQILKKLPQAARGHWPPNQNPADFPECRPDIPQLLRKTAIYMMSSSRGLSRRLWEPMMFNYVMVLLSSVRAVILQLWGIAYTQLHFTTKW